MTPTIAMIAVALICPLVPARAQAPHEPDAFAGAHRLGWVSTTGVSAPRAQPPAAGLSDIDAAAIRDVVRKYAEARESRDPKAIEVLFTPDADQLVSSGEWRRGREVLVRGALASSARTGGTRTLHVETIRMVGADTAIADARYEISGLEGGAVRRMWSTFVLARQQGQWRLAAIRNMLPAAPPGGPAARPQN